MQQCPLARPFGWQGEGALIPESIIGHQLARDARELRFDREGNEDLAVHCRRLWRACRRDRVIPRSEEHTSELQSLMRISYAVFCLKKKKTQTHNIIHIQHQR